MDPLHTQLSYLFNRWKDGSATTAEQKTLLELVQKPDLEAAVKDLIAKETEAVDSGVLSINKEQSQARADELLQRIFITKEPAEEQTPVIKLHPKRKFRWQWAAAAILVIALGSYFMFFNKKPEPAIAKTDNRFKNDVNPGKYKARLTLADGRVIVLDSVLAGQLATEGGTVIVNKDGQLVYQSVSHSNEVLNNTLSTAKGETYATILEDGSKVWLNSASSIKFPVAFTGSERKVEISGEAYFEVAKNAAKPFTVLVNGTEVQVLGTHFNINAYSDEAVIKTTLLEGSVMLRQAQHDKGVVIKPGEQAQVSNSIKVVKDADLDEVMAWKNGQFYFNSTDIETIMRQAARWYDMEVVYNQKITTRFNGEVNRNAKLTDLLKAMELSGEVKFGIDGKKIIVGL